MKRARVPEKRRYPNYRKIKNRPGHAPRRKKLRLTVPARIMMDRNFSKNRSRDAQLTDQLYANSTTRFDERNPIHRRAAYQTKITINVTDRKAKQISSHFVVDCSGRSSIAIVLTFYLISVDYVNPFGHQRDKQSQLVNVVLPIAVRVENQISGRVLETRPQRRSIALVLYVMNYLHMRGCARQFVRDGAAVVGAAVINQDHFIVIREGRQNRQSVFYQISDRCLIVEDRKEDANAILVI